MPQKRIDDLDASPTERVRPFAVGPPLRVEPMLKRTSRRLRLPMNPAPQPTDHTPGPAARAPLAAAEVGPSAPPKKGRPRKSTADLRTDQFRIRVTPKEKRRIEREAQKAGLSASDYLRRRALGQPVVARADSDAERQLKRIGGNLNQVARRVNQAGAAGLEGEVRAVLSEIREAIETLRRGTP